ncbi:hypothetical protein CHS0354_010507 [Potamilus streckersoni]|uniref:Uncharacterized protein n=1 Tax=Potamilus streckersoni TaxID=2493646 RepID=A0AAE0VPT1_9BIVA|nr:hypothetical protein CHS0354_010507 [Potamilus streckersoni]
MTVLQTDVYNTDAEYADCLRQDKTKVTDKIIDGTYLLVQDVNDATRIENTTEVKSLNLNKRTDQKQFSVHVYAKYPESTKQDALNEVEIINSSPQQALATTDDEINWVYVLAKNEMDKRKVLHVLQDDAENININMSDLPMGRQDGVSNVEIIKQIASSEFANMNGLEKKDMTMVDDNSKKIHLFVENSSSKNEIQSTSEFGVNETNVKMQFGIKDNTTTFKDAKHINSLEAEKMHDVPHDIINISDPTPVNFHFFVTNDNHESTIQNTTHTVSQNKDVMQIHMEDRASAQEGSRQDFAPEAEQTEDSDKVDTTEETHFLSLAESKKDKSLYMAQDGYTSPEKTTPDEELNTKYISSKFKAANQDFSLKKDGTKLIEGVGDEIKLSKNDNIETFNQIKTQYDSQNICLTAAKATRYVVHVMTENIDYSKRDEETQTDELPKESQLSMLDNIDESRTQCMTRNDFKLIYIATDELHSGMQNGPNDFETTEEDVSTKEENNTSGQVNASIVDGNPAESRVVGTENRTRFVIEYNFKNKKEEMHLDVQGSANTVKEIKHNVCPKANFVANVSYIKQDAPLGLQADIEECVIKTEVDISLENIYIAPKRERT